MRTCNGLEKEKGPSQAQVNQAPKQPVLCLQEKVGLREGGLPRQIEPGWQRAEDPYEEFLGALVVVDGS